MATKIGLRTNLKLPHIKQHVELSIMTGHTFLKGLLECIQKTIIEEHLYPHWLTGSPDGSKVFYPEFILGDITIDTSRVQMTTFGTGGTCTLYPALWIHKTLAYKMGWFQPDTRDCNPQFAVKLGSNLSIK